MIQNITTAFAAGFATAKLTKVICTLPLTPVGTAVFMAGTELFEHTATPLIKKHVTKNIVLLSLLNFATTLKVMHLAGIIKSMPRLLGYAKLLILGAFATVIQSFFIEILDGATDRGREIRRISQTNPELGKQLAFILNADGISFLSCKFTAEGITYPVKLYVNSEQQPFNYAYNGTARSSSDRFLIGADWDNLPESIQTSLKKLTSSTTKCVPYDAPQ